MEAAIWSGFSGSKYPIAVSCALRIVLGFSTGPKAQALSSLRHLLPARHRTRALHFVVIYNVEVSTSLNLSMSGTASLALRVTAGAKGCVSAFAHPLMHLGVFPEGIKGCTTHLFMSEVTGAYG